MPADRRWDALDVHRILEHALNDFALIHCKLKGEDYRHFGLMQADEQLRILRAFESGFRFMRQTITDDIAAQRKEKRVKRGV